MQLEPPLGAIAAAAGDAFARCPGAIGSQAAGGEGLLLACASGNSGFKTAIHGYNSAVLFPPLVEGRLVRRYKRFLAGRDAPERPTRNRFGTEYGQLINVR